jgi:ribosomal protein L33
MKKDIVLVCENCGQSFVWTGEEQDFFEKKDLRVPKYCMICRGIKEAASKDKFRGSSSFGKEAKKDNK